MYCTKVFGLILEAVGSQKRSLSGEVTQSDFSLTKITLTGVWRMKFRGGEPRGWKTGTVSQGAVMRESGAVMKVDSERQGYKSKRPTKVAGLKGDSKNAGGKAHHSADNEDIACGICCYPCPSNFLLL